jgi:N-acetylglucosaminyldiphosphoundecaprenol N-acetyl-beta-D-mannosaminyltransferase
VVEGQDVLTGAGTALDLLTGHFRDAPNWVKCADPQWLHRLGQEPTRLWRHYLINNRAFLWRIGL